MSDRKLPPHPPEMLIEAVAQQDGSTRVDIHGRDCERTREVHEAIRRGEEPRHPDAPKAARCGPAKVTSSAYRKNYDSVFGSRIPVGEA